MVGEETESTVQGFSNFSDDQNPVLGHSSRVSASAGVGVTKMCTSGEFPGDADAAGRG